MSQIGEGEKYPSRTRGKRARGQRFEGGGKGKVEVKG
jgi:hypothetical protein